MSTKVICVSVGLGHYHGPKVSKEIRLTLGRTYNVIDIWTPGIKGGHVGPGFYDKNQINTYYFMQDDMSSDYYPSSFFKTVDEVRNEKLLQIGI